jgi:DNA polymerase III subunit gamma/tau
MFEKKEKKILSTPTGKLNTTNQSIQTIINPKVETESFQEEQQDYSSRPQTPFGTDELKMAWKRYAFKVQGQGRPSLHSTLVKRDPKIVGDNSILFELDNTIQLSSMENERGDLLNYVRKELNNWQIRLEFKVIEENKAPSQLYSGMDKFKAMSEKNPNLSTLQRMFNLDIEF